MLKIILLICGVLMLTACATKANTDVKLPTIYNCRVGLVEGDSKWKGAELRQGLDVTDLKLAKGYERPQIGFTGTRYEDKFGEVVFTLSISSATLLIGSEAHTCTAIN